MHTTEAIIPLSVWNSIKVLVFFSLVLLLTGCEYKVAGTPPPVGPKIDGETIYIAPNSPQLNMLSISEVEPNEQGVTPMSGRLAWNEDKSAHIYTPLPGRIHRILVELGQQVTAGQALISLACPDYGQAQADAVRASADVVASEKSLNRVKDLEAHGAAATKDVEAAENDFTGKKAENERAQVRLRHYGGDKGEVTELFELKTPIDGEIVEKVLRPGEEVMADGSTALFVVSDPGQLWVYLDVTDVDMTKVHAGQEMRLMSPAYPGKTFPAKINFVGKSLDPITRTVKVRGVVENPAKELRAEMYVTVELMDRPSGGVVIPIGATFRKEDKDYTFVEVVPGQYERKCIKLGSESGKRVVVLDGLQRGQRVVSQSGLTLNGMIEAGVKN